MRDRDSDVGYLRLRTVLKDYLPVGRSSFYQAIREGRFPPPVKLGRMSVWRKADIIALCRRIESEAASDASNQEGDGMKREKET